MISIKSNTFKLKNKSVSRIKIKKRLRRKKSKTAKK